MMEPILTFESITKSFFGIHALTDVSLTLPRGHILGLVGENGAGKSTLMNVLGGVVKPDAGRMRLKGRNYAPRVPAEATAAGIAFIHQELNLFPNLSIADNLFIDRFPTLGRLPFIDRSRVRQRTRELLEHVGLTVAPTTLVENLTPGERQLVEIAKALGVGADIILFDEPTTSLTTRETKRLFDLIRQLRERGKSMIYISHTLGDVLELADEIAVLRDGTVVGAGARSKFTINRMIALMVGRDIEHLYPPKTSKPTSHVALAAKGLSQPGIIRNINFALRQGEVLGLFGLMGSGRTELARILFGLDPCQDGTIVLHGVQALHVKPANNIRRGMAFVTENRREEGLLMEASIVDNIGLVSLPKYTHGWIARLVDQTRLHTAVCEQVDSLQIRSGPVERHLAKNLSGGNQQKVVIGKWLMGTPSVCVMDEPTRGIDIGAKYEVYTIINDLAARGTAIVFISSELEELTAICDRILVMRSGEIGGEFDRGRFNEEDILRAAFGESGKADIGNDTRLSTVSESER